MNNTIHPGQRNNRSSHGYLSINSLWMFSYRSQINFSRLKWPFVSALLNFHHSIPYTDMCLDILRGIWSRFKFSSQRRHKDTERSDIIIPTLSPNILSYIGMGQHFTKIMGQKT